MSWLRARVSHWWLRCFFLGFTIELFIEILFVHPRVLLTLQGPNFNHSQTWKKWEKSAGKPTSFGKSMVS